MREGFSFDQSLKEDASGLFGFHICLWYHFSSWAIDRNMDRKNSASSDSLFPKAFSSQMSEEDVEN